MWDLPGPGLEPVTPTLGGGFLTTGHQGSPEILLFSLLLFTKVTHVPSLKVKRLRTENPGPLPTPLPRPEQTLADSSLTLRFLTCLHHCFTICMF